MPIYTVSSRNIQNFRKNRVSKEYGFRCWKCGKNFEMGETIYANGHKKRRYYCLKCARQLHFISLKTFDLSSKGAKV